jgi:Peptidase inhibitor family I36
MRFHRTRSLRRSAVIGTVALAATAGLVGLAAPASAYEKDGECEYGELCLYWWQGYGEPLFDMYYADPDFSDDVFPTDYSKYVDNNTRSYWNRDNLYWRVYDGYYYTGEELQCVEPGDRGNFSSGDWDRASSANYSSEPC